MKLFTLAGLGAWRAGLNPFPFSSIKYLALLAVGLTKSTKLSWWTRKQTSTAVLASNSRTSPFFIKLITAFGWVAPRSISHLK